MFNITDANFYTDTELRVNYIQVVASADTWVATLKDSNGNVVFDARSDISNDRGNLFYLGGTKFNGLTVETLTDVSMIIVGVA